MEYAERILALARIQPLNPTQVAKALGTDSILASAMLSDLVKKGQLKISSLKVGSSPLYYLPADKEKLLNYLTYFGGKDRKTVDILKQKGIIREKTTDPLTRVSLRTIKDFAVPLEVTSPTGKELFWKWFAVSDKEAEELIKNELLPGQPVIELPAQAQKDVEPKTPSKQEETLKETSKEVQKQREEKPAKRTRKSSKTSEFAGEVMNYFSKNKISIMQKIDENYIIDVESSLGKLAYYCMPKNKKSLTATDISNAFVKGQLHKLPSIIITKGETNKKAQEMLQQLKGVKVVKIGS